MSTTVSASSALASRDGVVTWATTSVDASPGDDRRGQRTGEQK
jgi:hypothetical protein